MWAIPPWLSAQTPLLRSPTILNTGDWFLEGRGHERKRTPSNRYTPRFWDENQRKPSEPCEIVNIAAGAEPSCMRQELCKY